MDRVAQLTSLVSEDARGTKSMLIAILGLAQVLIRARELGLELDEGEALKLVQFAVIRAKASELQDDVVTCDSCGSQVFSWTGGRLDADARRELEKLAPERKGLRVVR